LEDVPSTGLLVVTPDTDDGGRIPPRTRVEVLVSDAAPMVAAAESDGSVTVTVPTGSHTVWIAGANPYQADEVAVNLFREDVTRVHMRLHSQVDAHSTADP
jgi:hypothetical protein